MSKDNFENRQGQLAPYAREETKGKPEKHEHRYEIEEVVDPGDQPLSDLLLEVEKHDIKNWEQTGSSSREKVIVAIEKQIRRSTVRPDYESIEW